MNESKILNQKFTSKHNPQMKKKQLKVKNEYCLKILMTKREILKHMDPNNPLTQEVGCPKSAS